MPEGDTLRRTADGLRPFLVGRRVLAASARQPGPKAELLVGSTVDEVEAVGKNLLVRFDSGLELRTHLGMHGSWHRYRPGEAWRRAASRARLVLEVPGAVAVCFDAPTVELLERRAEPVHPPLARLGPDLLDPAFDPVEALARLRAPERAPLTIAEVLLDQRAMAGVGNVYKSETLFVESVHPFATVGSLGDETIGRLVETARRLLLANVDRTNGGRRTTIGLDGADGLEGLEGADARARRKGVDGPARLDGPHPSPARRSASDRPVGLWVYGRTGRPCRRCGAPILARRHGDLPRVTYWCPGCQGEGAG